MRSGSGAGNFQTARLRHRKDASVTRHAHGFVPQTLADLGIVGLALTHGAAARLAVRRRRALTGLVPRRNGAAARLGLQTGSALVGAAR